MGGDIHFEVRSKTVATPFVFVGREGLIGGFDLGEVLIGERVVSGIVGPKLVNSLRGCRACTENASG